MTPKSQAIITELQAVYDRLQSHLTIVETGTIRDTSPEFEAGDGHSTKDIAEWVKFVGGRSVFYSIDTNIETCKKYLFELSLRQYVALKQGYSTDILPSFKEIDFAYLDSANDAENCLNEFLLVWPKVTPGGCVMVDDCNEASVELLKGDKLIPYLRDNNIPFEQLPTTQLIIRK